MKKQLLTVVFLTCVTIINAQINAITETGDAVLLYENGTWSYANDSINLSSEIPENETPFYKSDKSTFLVKSTKLNIGVWINPKDWTFNKGEEADATEYEFKMNNEDLYALLITEKVEIPLEILKGIAIENAKKVAPDIKIISEEFRTVNGLKVYTMEMAGTIQGLKFIYKGYYYSNTNGTIQMLTYTSENLYPGYQDAIENFLNGLVEL